MPTLQLSDFRRVQGDDHTRIIQQQGHLQKEAKPGMLSSISVALLGGPSQQQLGQENSALRGQFVQALRKEYDPGVVRSLQKDFLSKTDAAKPLTGHIIRQVLNRADAKHTQHWKNQVRGALGSFPRTPEALRTDKTYQRQLENALTRLVAPFSGAERTALLNEMREMVNSLPSYIPKLVRERAHDLIDSHDHQVGGPGWAYIGPNKTGQNDEHVMNRGIAEIVMIGDVPHTPIYMAVYADALTSDKPNFKDFGQDEDGRVLIHTGNSDKSDESTLWVSMGRPLRQVKWLENYSRQGQEKGHNNQPLIRSFLLPLHIANQIGADTITEHNSKGQDRDLNVDKHYEANQYGIVKAESLELMREYALPGSLKTYTNGPLDKVPPSWGQVEAVTDLKTRLGVPLQEIPGFDVVTEIVDSAAAKRLYATIENDPQYLADGDSLPKDPQAQLPKMLEKFLPAEVSKAGKVKEGDVTAFLKPWIESGGKNPPNQQPFKDRGVEQKHIDLMVKNLREVGFIEKSTYLERANQLLTVFACHTGNENFMPEGTSLPASKPERDKVVDDFCAKHKPKHMDKETFIHEMVGPWATQARISHEISENFESLRAHEIDDLPRDAPYIEFNPSGDVRVGRAWRDEVSLGDQTRKVLLQRNQLRSGLGGLKAQIGKAFESLDRKDPARAILGPMKNSIDQVLLDYDFKIGRMSHVASALPEYQLVFNDYREALAAVMPKKNPPAALVAIMETLYQCVDRNKSETADLLKTALRDIERKIEARQHFMAGSPKEGQWRKLHSQFQQALKQRNGSEARKLFGQISNLFNDEMTRVVQEGRLAFAKSGQIDKGLAARLLQLPPKERNWAHLQVVTPHVGSRDKAFYASGKQFKGGPVPLDRSTEVTATGIANTGNSCYLAAGLSMLAVVEPYRALFRAENIDQANYQGRPDRLAAVRELQPLVWAVLNDVRAGNAVGTDRISTLLAAMDRHGLLPAPSLAAQQAGQTAQTAQQDPNEVIFRKLIPLFDPTDSLSLTQNLVTDFNHDLHNAVRRDDLAVGQYTALDHGVMRQQQPDPIVELPIVNQHGPINSLQEALAGFQAPEVMDGVLATNGDHVIEGRATRTLQLQGTPPAVTFTLRRGDGFDKDTHEVDAPPRLQINGQWYGLKAVVNHEGANLNSGHYTAMTVDPNDGSWQHRDDSAVSGLVTPEQDQSANNHAQKNRGYMFTYVREN